MEKQVKSDSYIVIKDSTKSVTFGFVNLAKDSPISQEDMVSALVSKGINAELHTKSGTPKGTYVL